MKPLLSICIPTYKRPELLKRTLLSFEGGAEDVEVIIGDNSPDDNCKKVVEDALAGFKGTWQYIWNNPALGPTENVNSAVRRSSGQFVYVIHDDDFVLPNGLKTLLKRLKTNPEYYVITFGVKIVDIEEKVIKVQAAKKTRYLPPEEATFNVLSNSSYIRQPAIVIRREAYDEIGFWNPEKAPPDDFDMFCRLLTKYGEYRLSDLIVAYTVHENAWTEKMFNPETVKILLDIFDETESKKVLPDVSIRKAKSSFFSQFILAGAYRNVRRKNLKEAKRIMKIFEMKELSDLQPPPKWLAVKSAISFITAWSR